MVPTDLINFLIWWAFRLAGVLAFVMIVYAGFQYLTSGGNTAQQKDAQERIMNAIIGLVLLFAFYIILHTINPNILKTSLESTSSNQITTLENTPNLPSSEAPNYNVSENLVNIIEEMGIPVNPAFLGPTEAYLDATLADKLSSLKNIEPEWWVNDACIDSQCQSTSEPNRNPDDCHLDGTCVDIDSISNNYNDNIKLIEIFNDAGLNVLDEGTHLHVALQGAEGCGSYPGNAGQITE